MDTSVFLSVPKYSVLQYLKGQSPNKRVTAKHLFPSTPNEPRSVSTSKTGSQILLSRRTSAERFYSGKPMKVLSVAVFSLLFGFIQTAAGLS